MPVRDHSLPYVMTGLNALEWMEGKPAGNKGCGRLQPLACGHQLEKAPPGFEPGMKVLQTSALPLGYGAAKWRAGIIRRSRSVLHPALRMRNRI